MVTNFRALATPARPPTIPIVVVTHGAGNPPPCQGGACTADFPVAALESAWQAGQAEVAHTLGARFVIAEGTGHAIADENPGLTVALTAEVIGAVRDPSTWATPMASPTA